MDEEKRVLDETDETFSTQELGVKKETLTSKMRENPWVAATFVLGIFSIIMLIANFGGMTGNIITGSVVSIDDAGSAIMDFATAQGLEAELVDVKEQGAFYEVTLSMGGQEFPVYVTKDGKYFTSSLIPLTEETSKTTSQEIVKSEKPLMQLFIMTHCPYGTQAEKGFIPFMKSAVGGLVTPEIRFVHYFMHEPEETETPRQVCIREEQPTKWLSYLTIFLEAGNYEDAFKESGVDVSKMNKCIDSGRWEDYYNEDKKLSEQYGVQGSPTLVVNGKIVSSGRSPSAYLDTACQAFNNIPSVCGTLELDANNPTPMWGWDTSSTATASGSC